MLNELYQHKKEGKVTENIMSVNIKEYTILKP